MGTIAGIFLHIGYEQFLVARVTAQGTLQFEPTADPAITPSYPAGYYVTSRVYLEYGEDELVGKRVTAWGRQTAAADLDGPHYPKILNHDLSLIASIKPIPIASLDAYVSSCCTSANMRLHP